MENLIYPLKAKTVLAMILFSYLQIKKKTLAQINAKLKNSLSHRKKALDELLKHRIFKNYFF